MKNEVFYTYEGVKFEIEFISNGYLLRYKDMSSYASTQKAFHKFEDLMAFLKEYYAEDWV